MANQLKKTIMILITVVMFLGLLAACGSNDEGNDRDQSGSAEGNAEEFNVEEHIPSKVTWMSRNHKPSDPNDTIINELKKVTGTDLEIIWVPNAMYDTRFQTSLASQELPDVITAKDIRDPLTINAVRSGVFWEIGPYLQDYPNLSKLDPKKLESLAVDGKIYGIYHNSYLSKTGLTWRQDWLENVGLEPPKTLEDECEIAPAFTHDDPDQNGQDDTYGVAERNQLPYGMFKMVATWHGVPHKWGIKDGEIVPEFMYPEYVEAMDFMKRLYDEKLMNQDFPVVTPQQQTELFLQGKAGLYGGNIGDMAAPANYSALKEINPNAEVDITNKIASPDGEYYNWSNTGKQTYLFSKSSIKDEDELRGVLAVMDRLYSEEGMKLIKFGIEGVHYKVVDGFAERIDVELWDEEVNSYGNITGPSMDLLDLELKPDTEYAAKRDRMWKENETFATTDPTVQLSSKTFDTRGTDLLKIIEDATIQYILGDLDKNGFADEIERWKNSGGTEMMEEFTASYKALQ